VDLSFSLKKQKSSGIEDQGVKRNQAGDLFGGKDLHIPCNAGKAADINNPRLASSKSKQAGDTPTLPGRKNTYRRGAEKRASEQRVVKPEA